MTNSLATALTATFGREARDRLNETEDPGRDGALAALETFYYAFNNRSLQALSAVWLEDPLIQLNNPLGGILRGIDGIRSLYERVFSGQGRAWVEFYDIVEFSLGQAITFAGRERGEFTTADSTVPLAIRTTRVFAHIPDVGWRQVHHHGSIDDPASLAAYQRAVRGPQKPSA
jgi:ketosteroid isomerase-like protein